MRGTSDGELSKLIKLRSHTIVEDLFYGNMEMRKIFILFRNFLIFMIERMERLSVFGGA